MIGSLEHTMGQKKQVVEALIKDSTLIMGSESNEMITGRLRSTSVRTYIEEVEKHATGNPLAGEERSNEGTGYLGQG